MPAAPAPEPREGGRAPGPLDALDVLAQASRLLDADLVRTVLHPDVQFHTPASAHLVFRGRGDVHQFFRASFGIFDQLHLRAALGEGRTRVLVVDGRFGRFGLTDALLVELAEDGSITTLVPHLRPWPSSTLFILLVAARLARHPRLLLRSLGRPRRSRPAGWPISESTPCRRLR